MPVPLIPLAAGASGVGALGAGAAGGGFLASAGGAATIDLISGLLGGIMGGMGMNQQMKLWEKMTQKKIEGLGKYVKPKTPYSEWYKGRAAPMADYLQNIITQTMEQRGLS